MEGGEGGMKEVDGIEVLQHSSIETKPKRNENQLFALFFSFRLFVFYCCSFHRLLFSPGGRQIIRIYGTQCMGLTQKK